jgi:hypothetical protein
MNKTRTEYSIDSLPGLIDKSNYLIVRNWGGRSIFNYRAFSCLEISLWTEKPPIDNRAADFDYHDATLDEIRKYHQLLDSRFERDVGSDDQQARVYERAWDITQKLMTDKKLTCTESYEINHLPNEGFSVMQVYKIRQ